MIDIHCHILPATDDGPNTMETSLAMAEISAADGIQTIIATPHTDGIRVNRESVIKGVAKLNIELQLNKTPLKVLPGYELPFHLVSELGPTHTLAGSKYLLIEFPHQYIPQGASSTLYNLIYSGFKPIIAHPERNNEVLANPTRLVELVETGALVQLTASSITGDLGPDIQHCAHYLLNNGIGDFIATDSHSPAFRAPVLSKAHVTVKKLLGRKKADLLVMENPRKIIQDAK